MTIQKHKVVSVTYELHINDTTEKNVFIERAEKENPLTFLFGTGGMIVGFEKNLNGLNSGDKFDFRIPSSEGYGDYDLSAIVSLPKEVFKTEGMIDKELMQVGNMVPMMDNQGNRLEGKVLEVEETTVKMDFNHPLAGKELHFKGEIIAIREATQEEVAHGHVHDGHGHHH